MGRSSEARKIGDSMAACYRRDRPHVAEIDEFVSMWGFALLFPLPGATSLLVGVGSSRAAWQPEAD
jgi:hypothetical protein